MQQVLAVQMLSCQPFVHGLDANALANVNRDRTDAAHYAKFVLSQHLKQWSDHLAMCNMITTRRTASLAMD